eukprot:2175485-Pleurochrysis_carterae.AAC.1
MTDASNTAAGAVLMQWQRPPQWNDKERELLWEPDDNDELVSLHKKRMEAGYRMTVLSYFSKSFNSTQRNWTTFDKEAASYLLAFTHCWHRLVAYGKTTVYTDSTVAASMLSNHKVPRPQRLERWGVVLGTYLPHLRVAYRMGGTSLVADELSGFVTQVEYQHKPKIVSVTHRGRRFKLVETKDMQMLQEILKSADCLKKDDLNALRKLTNYKKGSGVANHVFSEEERSRLPDALRDAPSFASQYAFSVNQVAEEKMTTGEQADLNALLDATLAHVLATDQTFAAE